MLTILAMVIAVFFHYVGSKTIDDFPFQSDQTCDECYRIYFPVCASDNKTYTNECKFRCKNNQRKRKNRAKIIRYGPCILGS